MERVLDRDRLFRYLLGELAEPERELLEERYFSDDEVFAQVAAAEDDLIDLYVIGSLKAQDRARFESHFLAAPGERRKRRVEFARKFLSYVKDQAPPEEKVAWWRSIFAPLAMPRLAMAGMALGLAVAGWLAFDMSQRRTEAEQRLAREKVRSEQLQRELAASSERKEQEPVLVAKAIPIPMFTLSPVLERSGAGITVRPNGAASVRLRLALEPGADWATYAATLETAEGRAVWTGGGLRAARGAVDAVVPATALPAGTYVLRLRGITAAGASESVADYTFQAAARP